MTEKRLILGFGIFFTVGLVLHMVPVLQIVPVYITDVFLLTANLIVFWQIYRINPNKLFLVLSLAACILTFGAEAAGVHTGRIFGDYQYGNTLKLQLLAVPVIIPFNWMMLVYGMTSISQGFKISKWLVPLFSAIGLVLFDYTMEPVAIHLDYWSWAGGKIPFENYLTWFIIALLVSSATIFLKINLDRKLLRYYVMIQWIFFLVLNVFFHFNGA